LIFLVGGVARLSGKYGHFAYRLINLDAGCALAQMGILARAAGVTMRAAPSWTERIARSDLELLPGRELITAVVGLYGPTGSGDVAGWRDSAGRPARSDEERAV